MELKELYREVILDHNRSPRNFGRLDPADLSASGHNPLCGDRLELTLRLGGDRIAQIRFEGHGCAISMASASLMTEAVTGRAPAEVEQLYREVHELLTGRNPSPSPALGKLLALGGVAEFPVRVKCASLCWHTLHAALERARATAAAPAAPTRVSTE